MFCKSTINQKKHNNMSCDLFVGCVHSSIFKLLITYPNTKRKTVKALCFNGFYW